jgi:phosphatidylserine/phosphatidylglycerophosphate/cardiolipin synthase-like enzyme
VTDKGQRVQFVTNEQIYKQVILEAVPSARKYVWLGTSDLKDLYVNKGRKMVPFLEVLSGLVSDGVQIRLIHAKEPGPIYRRDFDKYKNLIEGMERLLCPRIHFKSVVVDGKFAYCGSANLTGAGMGAKGVNTRNFESGFVFTEPEYIKQIMTEFDELWMGKHCTTCKRKQFCGEYKELI